MKSADVSPDAMHMQLDEYSRRYEQFKTSIETNLGMRLSRKINRPSILRDLFLDLLTF